LVKGLVIEGEGIEVDIDSIVQATGVEVTRDANTFENGLLIMKCGSEIDYAIADYVIVIGDCNTGRAHVDISIGPSEDYNGKLIEHVNSVADVEDVEFAHD
jgi:hypothetical protein